MKKDELNQEKAFGLWIAVSLGIGLVVGGFCRCLCFQFIAVYRLLYYRCIFSGVDL